MKYTLRAGRLSEKDSGHTLARLRGTIPGQSRQVSGEDGGLLLRTEVRLLESSGLRPCDVRLREYVMLTVDGETLAIARPGYSEHDDPDVCGWPANHMPRVDHAALYFGGRGHMLVMRSAMRYELLSQGGALEVSIDHRGLAGGWDIEADDGISAAFLLGLFSFCRYMERENGSVCV